MNFSLATLFWIITISAMALGIFAAYRQGLKNGQNRMYHSIKEDGFSSGDVPWRVKIPTKDINGRVATIYVYPWPLNKGFLLRVVDDQDCFVDTVLHPDLDKDEILIQHVRNDQD